jgi:hypothetical protein
MNAASYAIGGRTGASGCVRSPTITSGPAVVVAVTAAGTGHRGSTA